MRFSHFLSGATGAALAAALFVSAHAQAILQAGPWVQGDIAIYANPGMSTPTLRDGGSIPLLGAANTWAAQQTFSLNPIWTACTGYMLGNGASPASCAATIPTSALTGGIAASTLTGLGTGVSAALGNATNGASGLLTYSGAFGTPTQLNIANATDALAVSGGDANLSVQNTAANASGNSATLENTITGTANAYGLFQALYAGGTPKERLSVGSGMTGGVIVDASGGGTSAPLTLTGGVTASVVVSNLSTAGVVTTTAGGKLGSEASATVAHGGTASTKGALSVWSCTIPDTAGTSVDYCPWKAANTASVAAFFDDFAVGYASTCSTTYPVVEIYDVTQAAALGSTTVPNTSTTITSVNASAAGAAAGDTYSFRVTTPASGCSSTLATEFLYLTASVRN